MTNTAIYKTNSPVLFIVFNRPAIANRVFEQIRFAQPKKLYIAADGPRETKPGERELCDETRLILNLIDWDCEVFTKFNPTNLGCKNAVSSAVTWFFEQEEEGIILEDDCLPDNSFFRFCDELLRRYRYDTRVRHISGSNFQRGRKWGNATYYYSNLTHVWGWAGWRRVWADYDKELSAFTPDDAHYYLKLIFNEPIVVESWLKIFTELKAGNIDTWDYQLTFLNFFNNSLSVIPNNNLICNIGFGDNATHTIDPNNPFSNNTISPLTGDIAHPLFILPEKQADNFTLNYDFDVVKRAQKQKSLKFRVKKMFR